MQSSTSPVPPPAMFRREPTPRLGVIRSADANRRSLSGIASPSKGVCDLTLTSAMGKAENHANGTFGPKSRHEPFSYTPHFMIHIGSWIMTPQTRYFLRACPAPRPSRRLDRRAPIAFIEALAEPASLTKPAAASACPTPPLTTSHVSPRALLRQAW